MKTVKAIITGTTGMVGEGVLHECLNHPDVESILVVNRRTCNASHPKLKEILHNNFHDFTSIEDRLTGYNACFFCLGTTSVGKNEEEYTRITYELTKALADNLIKLNPEMTFCYVSGVGTDSTENGKVMWARVKGRTENYLLNLGFKKAFVFRPGIILPTKGLKNTLTLYKIFFPLLPIVKFLFPKYICTLREIGKAMINSVTEEYEKEVLEVRDIESLAQK
ncbi:MAG: epimerase [Ignavibacteria bacterium GWA2_35_9]|nr:MAG: epimerase [Ignavibacteria bacterium GWA2_35_9]OGU43723.1 MAG: epimerase [Ignavibacteria bacterium GWB2_36_8]